MAVPKIVLFYVFTPLADPEAIRLWQYTLAEAHNLTGRILVSEHGINATVGGDIRDVKRYVKGTRSYAPFKDADIKWSDGLGDDFPRLSVKVRSEIVTFGAPGELKVDADGVVGGGTHLAPDEVHRLVEGRGDDVVFFDGRNGFEAEIGRFRDAVVPDVSTTRDFVHELDSGKYDHLKDKAVVTYCTGGVRCEVLSSLMRSRGFGEVYQLDGGIVRYGEAFGDSGLWEGSLYVFDKRMAIEFSDQAKTLGRCTRCGGPTSRYENLPDDRGRELVLVCAGCTENRAG
ncbi:oxygen-dependent tRNA uridine(34) hydroxylase TrhO [Rhodococcus opacus]|uniref:oxygen-dependent tRNA uridine(34) hydroxylase TrhO n=1 Tax=Rhodococcus opacus TaxID=37919 RepID=UPI001C453E2D|nr:rhodanese-related sulfurtransferase [Rhodococcus opacus]MBV6762462.1 rhodanese-related sulfurtransferase [Rhodococcus opacus]